jgi:putative membrane protein
MGAMLSEARHRGWIDQWEWQAIDRTLSELMSAQGGTERIKNTPLPKQYDFFVILFVHVYCMLLPVGMVEGLGWFTPLGSTLVGFMFLALDRIGRSLEDPFENTIYDVPLTAITKTIEINLRQLLDESELPAPEAPVKGVLW